MNFVRECRGAQSEGKAVAEGQDGNGRMMSSDELREHLSAYLDGQLSDWLREQMEQTLESDEALRAELESLRDLVDGLKSFPAAVAPGGFAVRVMAEVEDLEIPAPREAGGLERGRSSEFEQELLPLTVPMWLKGSIAASMAATLLLGYFVFRAPLRTQEWESANIAARSDADASWGAPLATGFELLPDSDAVVSLDSIDDRAGGPDGAAGEGFHKRSRASGAQMPRPEPAQQKPSAAGDAGVVSAGKTPSTLRARKKSGLQEVTGEGAGSRGVYEAEHEDADTQAPSSEDSKEEAGLDGVVALDVDAASADEDVGFKAKISAPEMRAQPEAEDQPSAAPAFEADSEMLSLEATRQRSSAEGQNVRALRRGGGYGRSGKAPVASSPNYESEAVPPAEELSADIEMVSEEQGDAQVDAPSIAAKVVIGTLVVASPGVISTLAGEIRAKRWSLQNLTSAPDPALPTPASGSQILQIMVPQGSEEELTRLLDGYGALNTDQVLAAAHDGKARLRLTIRWGN